MKFEIPLATSSSIVSYEKFWHSVMLYHNRPHLVNRKISSASASLFFQVTFHSKTVQLQELLNRSALLYELRKLDCISPSNIQKEFVINLLESYDKKIQLKEVSEHDCKLVHTGTFVSLKVLYPRMKNCPNAVEIVTFDKEHNNVVFLAVSDSDKQFVAPIFPYELSLTSNSNLVINVSNFDDADTVQAFWLVEKLFTKLLKWIESEKSESHIQSLSLIEAEEYCETYIKLKMKYGPKLVQDWPKVSSTDPQKYVYEDIAIVSYLLCLWKNEPNVKFVDCGCGNGLLVHLLNQEGYEGFGVDIRQRPMWHIYPKSTILKVEALSPDTVFPNSTWIIGNHSDELTPWIPVFALKSACNFFVLPCCPYDFSGQKFIRTNTALSAYADYLLYIEDVSKQCGFQVAIDKLRIPSTKRTCLIGKINFLENDKEVIEKINKMLEVKLENCDFTPRNDVEKVRNCTKLNKNIVSNIVKICVSKLLSHEDFMKKYNGELWNKGGSFKIADLVCEIPKEYLSQLKQECGGLQTLLRNHRYLFSIAGGFVQLRLPHTVAEETKYLEKPCWFVRNHPNGCLFDANLCGYQH
ncbi:hypothetical protein ABEB36_009877 [Hypothenemus hampei]|uniref:tRNA (uracil-O(2)-)-methyltransferase n=1 Tax=Hypothenemus hampei TaxID=57062 RepID=A0ABD1EHS4_HYPHA